MERCSFHGHVFRWTCHEIHRPLNCYDGRIRNVSVMIDPSEWMKIGSKHRWNLKLTETDPTRCWHGGGDRTRSRSFHWILCIVVNHCTCFSCFALVAYNCIECICSFISTTIHKCLETGFLFFCSWPFCQLFLIFFNWTCFWMLISFVKNKLLTPIPWLPPSLCISTYIWLHVCYKLHRSYLCPMN